MRHHREIFCQRIAAVIQEVKRWSTVSTSDLQSGQKPSPTPIPLLRSTSNVGIRFNSVLHAKTLHFNGIHLHQSHSKKSRRSTRLSKDFLTELTENIPELSGTQDQSSALSDKEIAETALKRASSSPRSTSKSGLCFHNQFPHNRSRMQHVLTTSSEKRCGKASLRGTSLNQGSSQKRIRSPLPTTPLKNPLSERLSTRG
ncbi:hypothetical protein HanIR_Chr17g0872741 [Helianthus annuus]|nr:hypothetical protein HanIR_Chr17g0872741 [Helianthus annuus]